jgi:hypothetical protein
MSEKVILRCRHCYLRYELTRFPAFEEVDYYNKMLDIYRTENWAHKMSKNSINKNTDKKSDEDTPKKNSNCPICKIGNLYTSNYFIRGCQIIKCNNDDCNTTFQAPKGECFQVSEYRCTKCDWPLIASKDIQSKTICFNPNCPRHASGTITQQTIDPNTTNNNEQNKLQQNNKVPIVTGYSQAAEQGDANAQYNLANCYFYGVGGMQKDYGQAVKWFTKAAQQGHNGAQSNLVHVEKMLKNHKGA